MKLLSELERFFSLKSDSLDPWRKKAWDRAAHVGEPVAKSDGFAYVPLSAWAEKIATPEAGTEPFLIEPITECKDSYLVFVDGSFAPHLSKWPEKLTVLALADAMKSYGLFLQQRLQKTLKEELDFFALLNGACHSGGLFLYVPAGVLLSQPLQIIHASTKGSLSFPRIQIALGANAELKLVQLAPASNDISCIDATLDESSRLTLYDLSSPSNSAWQMHAFRASLKRNSYVEAFYARAGSGNARTSFKVDLLEEGADALLQGVSLLSEKAESHIHGRIEHKAPSCRSRQHFKAILEDKSRSSFEGKIYVHPEAQKTEAYQRSETLLLSEEAISYARPNLEIFADDVKASHGSTVSPPDAEALFYLRSRGLGEKAARALLIEGFCKEILTHLHLPSFYEELKGFHER